MAGAKIRRNGEFISDREFAKLMKITLGEMVIEGLDNLERQGASGNQNVRVQIGVKMEIVNGKKRGLMWSKMFDNQGQ